MAMMDKLKDKLPGKKYGKGEEEEMAKPAGIEIEIGEDETESPDEGSLASEGEAEEEVSVGELAKLSDEELLAEVKKRGLELGGQEQPEMPEEEIVSPSKKKPMA